MTYILLSMMFSKCTSHVFTVDIRLRHTYWLTYIYVSSQHVCVITYLDWQKCCPCWGGGKENEYFSRGGVTGHRTFEITRLLDIT